MEPSPAIAVLVVRHIQDEPLSIEEMAQFREWLNASPLHKKCYGELKSKGIHQSHRELLEDRKENYAAILKRLNAGAKIRRLRWPLIIAACTLIPLFASLMIMEIRSHSVRMDKPGDDRTVTKLSRAILPAGPRATLILGDGRQIALDSGSALSMTANGVAIRSITGQELEYVDQHQLAAVGVTHTLITPKSGTYRVILPDKTTVWLNADSRLTYPTQFKEVRQVQLQGEAYFEVAHQPDVPFRVEILGSTRYEKPTTVEVLGTHFNVKAYKEESAIRTTLLQGAVRVRHGEGNKILKVGQQATVKHNRGDEIEVKKVPVQDAIGWKEGFFTFDQQKADEILSEIGRWYDVQFLWETPVPTEGLLFVISRKEGIDETLRLLEQTGVGLYFYRDGRHIHVTGKRVE